MGIAFRAEGIEHCAVDHVIAFVFTRLLTENLDADTSRSACRGSGC